MFPEESGQYVGFRAGANMDLDIDDVDETSSESDLFDSILWPV